MVEEFQWRDDFSRRIALVAIVAGGHPLSIFLRLRVPSGRRAVWRADDCGTSFAVFPGHPLPAGYARIRMRTASRGQKIRRAGPRLRISFSFHRSSNKRMQASSHDSLSEFECPYACQAHDDCCHRALLKVQLERL